MELEKPLLETNKRNLKLASQILRGSLPSILCNFFLNFIENICFFYIGTKNDPALTSAVGFTLTWSVAMTLGFSFSIILAFAILGSKLYGAKLYYKFGVMFQKTCVLVAACNFLTFIPMIFSSPILKGLGFETLLAENVTLLVKYSFPYYFMYCVNFLLNIFMVSQGHYFINGIVSVVGAGFQGIFGYIMIVYFDMSLAGVGVSRACTHICMASMYIFYIKKNAATVQGWIPWTKECLEGLGKYATLVAKLGISTYLSWMTSELLTVMIGRLNNEKILAGQSSAFSIAYLVFNLHFSISITTNVMFGNSLGELNIQKSKQTLRMGLMLNMGMVCLIWLGLLEFRYWLAGLYSQDPEVIEVMATILFLYCALLPSEMTNTLLGYCIRTLGFEGFYMNASFIGYYGVAIPIALILGFVCNFSYIGIWIGAIIGWAVLCLSLIRKFLVVDWESEVRRLASLKKTAVEGQELEDLT